MAHGHPREQVTSRFQSSLVPTSLFSNMGPAELGLKVPLISYPPLKGFQCAKSWIVGCSGTAKPVSGQAERAKCCSSGHCLQEPTTFAEGATNHSRSVSAGLCATDPGTKRAGRAGAEMFGSCTSISSVGHRVSHLLLSSGHP